MKNKGMWSKNKEAAQAGQDDRAGAKRYQVLETFLLNRAPLRRFISRYLLPADQIDDIAQEAFLRAYVVEKKKRIEAPKAFLFRIAKNLVLSGIQKKSTRLTDYIEDFEPGEILLEEESLEDNLMAQQKLGIYCEAVAALPPQCRRVFLLKKSYGMSHNEIAENMGIAVSTVEKHLAKAVRFCSKTIDERYRVQSASHHAVTGTGVDRRGLGKNGKGY